MIINTIILIIGLFQTDTPTPTLTPTPTGAPYCEVDHTTTPTFPFNGEFEYIEFNTPTLGVSATPDGTLTPFPTQAVTPTPLPTLDLHVYLTNPSNLFLGTKNITTSSYSFDLGYFPVERCAVGDKVLFVASTYNCTGIQCNNIRTQYGGYELYGTNYSHTWTENSVNVSIVPTAKAMLIESYPWASGASNQYYNNMPEDISIYQRFSGGPQNGSFTVNTDYMVKACYGNENYPTATPVPTSIIPTLTPTYCRMPLEQAENGVTQFTSDYVGQSCFILLPSVYIDFDDLPDWMQSLFGGAGGAELPIIDIQGITICLDRYSLILKILNIDFVPFITALISLLSAFLVIQEFRS